MALRSEVMGLRAGTHLAEPSLSVLSDVNRANALGHHCDAPLVAKPREGSMLFASPSAQARADPH